MAAIATSKNQAQAVRQTKSGQAPPITVKDVAAKAGVHYASVSVALNGARSGTGLSEETRTRILLAAEELGYKRNGSMAAARSGRFGSVALLLSTEEFRSNLPPRMWDGIHDELARHDLHLTMTRLPDEKLTDAGTVPKVLREWMADGLLIDYTNHIPTRMIELIRAHRLPAVWINSNQQADCVYPDDREAATRLTRHLLQLGHRDVLYTDFTHDPDDAHEHYSCYQRIAGYRAVMEEIGLQPRIEPAKWMPVERRAAYVARLLKGSQRPTAIIGYGHIEVDVIAAAAGELGWRVPRDLSVASFGPADMRYPGLALTTCVVPEYEVGKSAAQMLLQKVDDPKRVFTPQIVPFGWSEGQTCAPPAVV